MAPHYGGMLKIIVVIERSAVFRQIPGHLGLPTGVASLRAPPYPSGARRLTRPASGPTNPPLTISPSPIRRLYSRRRGAGLFCAASSLAPILLVPLDTSSHRGYRPRRGRLPPGSCPWLGHRPGRLRDSATPRGRAQLRVSYRLLRREQIFGITPLDCLDHAARRAGPHLAG